MAKEIVIDIETKKSFDEVGGQENLTLLGVSCAGAYFYEDNSYYAYEEHELPKLQERLLTCDRIIGFNINHFDLPILATYIDAEALRRVPRLDLFEEVVKKLGHRLSLDSLASATLGAKKIGNGLAALQWYKEGKMDLIKKYCLEDVRLTKELYEFGKSNGKLYYSSYFKPDKMTVAVDWKDVIPGFLRGGAPGIQGRLL